MGACPARHRFALPLWKTQWGLAPRGTGSTCQSGTRRGAQGGGRLPTLPLVLLLSPSPRPPSPPGKGETLGYFYARGFAPCIPATKPARHWGRGEPRARRGAQGGAVARRPCRCGVRRGACLLCRPPTLPLACFSAPLPRRGRIDPQPPSRREGGDFRLFCARGFAPCIPAPEPAARRKTDRKRFSMSRAGSQGEGGPGEMELSVASDGGV